MSTITETMTKTEQASTPKSLDQKKPQIGSKPHMMTATWHLKDPSEWDFWQRFLIRLNVLQQPAGCPPAPLKEGTKVPYYPVWRQHLWIAPRAALPLLIHHAYMRLTGWTLHPVAAFFFYFFSFKIFAVASVRKFNRLALRYGYFDGKVPRDGVPDVMSRKVALSMLLTISIRPLFALFVAYDRYELPTLSPWLPLQIFAYACILDFYFYIYHRAMHEVPWLWKHHALHHRTKHPNPLLSAFADSEQEWGDILVIPLLTWLTMPISFSTWWMCTLYILYTEAMGHSGVRLYWQTPTTGPILRLFDMDLCLEDHDQHHRNGWRKSSNYGKQTRLWDTIFGSTRSRIECTEDNIDWVNTPWW
ncbi:fatty acid hydroxylase superfamily protein [Violaceomyces palustris]|uniref:Fatty acid hydroxylase superfamily protein n=1 Tax=Violaceomyces palustris TaxID=1673888 RepID=A0ACD0NZ10_9BASI|nr:fatty acid hydroxylase superfamily protein [Violaceomyces palustris]